MEHDLKEKEFIILLGEDSRIRHYHGRMKQQVVEFMVQLELHIKGEWKPVIRYDTAHGFAHRDTYSGHGKVEKIPLSIGDFNSTLIFAEFDIRSNWELYRERFLREVFEND